MVVEVGEGVSGLIVDDDDGVEEVDEEEDMLNSKG